MQETLQSGASWKASRSRSSLAHESRWTHPGGLTAHAMPLCTFFFSLMPLLQQQPQNIHKWFKRRWISQGGEVSLAGLSETLDFWFLLHHKHRQSYLSVWAEVTQDLYGQSPDCEPLHLYCHESIYLSSVVFCIFTPDSHSCLHLWDWQIF